jgi:A/G-specific adenine glycosylase
VTGKAANFHRSVRHALAKWFRAHRRDLPWRPTPQLPANPYHVLVSEAMLQQTQVATVVPYFLRFIEAFSTIESLAAADEQQVLRLWQGLGYYRRALSLHAAARAIVAEHGGRVPASLDDLLQLPGVGRYTAGAIASIAYDVPAPILDGNVARVLARVCAIDGPVDQPATRRQLWALAEQLVPTDAPGDFNQAMMELGAMVCTPKQPLCLTCPLRDLCEAQRRGLVDRLPVTSARRKPTAVEHHVVVLRCGRRYLFEQRPPRGLWAGMWQFPTCEDLADATLEHWVKNDLKLTASGIERVDAFSHQLTHRTVTFVVWRGQVQRASAGRMWRRLDDLDDLPLANPQRRVAAMIGRMVTTAAPT